jgi:hypothetical protein
LEEAIRDEEDIRAAGEKKKKKPKKKTCGGGRGEREKSEKACVLEEREKINLKES